MKSSLVAILYEAFDSPRGLVVRSDDREALRQRLYAARRGLEDPRLSCLSFFPSPRIPNELWLVKQGVGVGQSDLSP